MGVKIYKDGVEVANLPAVGRPIASQAEAEAGTNNTRQMTPLRVWQAITAYLGLGSLAGQAGKAIVVNGTEDGLTLASFTNATTLGGQNGAYYLDRSHHTGSQMLSTISDAGTAASRNVPASGNASSTEVLLGTDTRLADARTPTSHAASHQAGGGDAIKLDDLATPDDTTDLDATTGHHGLLKKLSGTSTEYFDGSGNWSTPAGGGDVLGPASAVVGNVASYSNIDGKHIVDSGLVAAQAQNTVMLYLAANYR